MYWKIAGLWKGKLKEDVLTSKASPTLISEKEERVMDPVTFEPEVSSYMKKYHFRISSFEILATKGILVRNILFVRKYTIQ